MRARGCYHDNSLYFNCNVKSGGEIEGA
ncbi:Positive regulator of purine utilization, partial [Fusarium oxysporum f. sp. albedinis]